MGHFDKGHLYSWARVRRVFTFADVIAEIGRNTLEIFVSYSHKDKDLLASLVAQLKALEQAGLLEVWADTRIDAGDKWYPEIEGAMKRAAVAVCMVSEYFLSSDFCTKEEVPFLLKRAADEGLGIRRPQSVGGGERGSGRL